MRVGVIGPGRVGGAISLGLIHAGHDVVSVSGRSGSASLATFSGRFPGAGIRPLEEVSRDVDLVVVATPDDTISEVAGAVVASGGVGEGQRWIHLAGGQGTDVLSVVAAAGGRVAACHPAMTFPDAETGYESLPGTSWAVTAAEADLGWARVLVTDLRGSPVTIRESDRTLYHAGLAVGSNATTAVVTLARDMLLGAGISDPGAFLGPLATTSAAGGAQRGVDALTGPVRRGDAGTVERHMAVLRAAFPEAMEAYVAIGHLILAQAERAGLDPDRAAAVRRTLDGR